MTPNKEIWPRMSSIVKSDLRWFQIQNFAQNELKYEISHQMTPDIKSDSKWTKIWNLTPTIPNRKFDSKWVKYKIWPRMTSNMKFDLELMFDLNQNLPL